MAIRCTVSLDRLRIPATQPLPTAEQRKELHMHLLRNRLLSPGFTVPDPARFRHPFRVRVRRFQPPEGGRAAFTADNAWEISIRSGAILDQLPSILYRREGDPRGWDLPKDYVESEPVNSPWVERDLLDDPSNPPILVVRDPDEAAAKSPDFTRIADKDRLAIEGGAFCSEADWGLELWRAHVVLTARPFRQSWQSVSLPAPRLNRFRLYTLRSRPSISAAAGATFELATLYLLRDPQSPASARLKVRQHEWWGLWTTIVQPAGGLPALIGGLADGQGGINDLLAQLASAEIEETLSAAATIEAWTV